LKAESGHKSSKSGPVWRLVEGTYMLALRFSLRHRWVVIAASVLVLFSTPVLLAIIGKDFIPRDDQSELEVAMRLPEGYTLERADEVGREIEARLRKLRGVTHTFTVIGDTTGRVTKGQGDVTQASIYVRLVDLRKRDYTQFEIMAEAREIMADY